MADEINLHFMSSNDPDMAIVEWRRNPPPALAEGKYELVDQAYNSLSYEARYYDWPAKLLMYTTFGVGYLLRGTMESLYSLTVHFSAEGEGTKVTVVGKADPKTRAALGDLADQYGGAVGQSWGTS